MSRLRMCWSLLCAAAVLHSRASSDEAVILECQEPEEVEAGGTVTITCTVRYNLDPPNCEVENVTCSNTNTNISYHNWKMDNPTAISLNIPNVRRSENYTMKVQTDCGSDECNVSVSVTATATATAPSPYAGPGEVISSSVQGPAVWALCVTFTVVCFVLYFLFGTKRGKKVIRLVRMDTDTELLDKDLLTPDL